MRESKEIIGQFDLDNLGSSGKRERVDVGWLQTSWHQRGISCLLRNIFRNVEGDGRFISQQQRPPVYPVISINET